MPAFFRVGEFHHDERRRAVGDGTGICRGNGTVFLESRFQIWNLFYIGGEGLFVGINRYRLFAGIDGNADDFIAKRPILDGFGCSGQRFNCEVVLIFTAEAIPLSAVLGIVSHELTRLVGIFQTIYEHMIEQFAITQAVAAAGLGQEVGCIAHALETAGNGNATTAGQDMVMREHRGFHPGATHFVDGGAGCAHGQAGSQCCLSGRGLTKSRRQDTAHQDLFYGVGSDGRPLDSGGHCRGTEFRGGHLGKAALETADWGARCTGNNNRVIPHHGFPLGAVLEQFSTDQHPSYFTCPRADFIKFRIP